MKIRFLGSGDGKPCSVKRRLIKDFRRPDCILIDDKVLINPGDEALSFADEFGFSSLFSEITDVIFTKNAPVGLSDSTLEKLSAGKNINIYAQKSFFQSISLPGNFSAEAIRPFVGFRAGHIDVTPLLANCEGGLGLALAIFSDRAVFYQPSGAGIIAESHSLIKNIRFDAAIFDCAMADFPLSAGHFSHNGIDSAVTIKAILIGDGLLGERSRFILTSLPTDKKRADMHGELASLAAEAGMTAAYDGYFITL